MSYTVSQLAKKAGITPRTLRHYDKVGLLSPSFLGKNGYRYYEETDLLTLQQILFFRELDFSLEDIKRILSNPGFDVLRSLREQERLLFAKQRRLKTILTTIQSTIHAMQNNQHLSDNELYEGFSSEEIERMKQEAKDRWGNTDAYKQSQERVAKFTKADWAEMKAATATNIANLIALMNAGTSPADPKVQAEIANHHAGINRFYDCTPEIYRGLADMYVQDPRFRKHYDDQHAGLAEFLAEGMRIFADQKSPTE